jgi:hypothetical protein
VAWRHVDSKGDPDLEAALVDLELLFEALHQEGVRMGSPLRATGLQSGLTVADPAICAGRRIRPRPGAPDGTGEGRG